MSFRSKYARPLVLHAIVAVAGASAFGTTFASEHPGDLNVRFGTGGEVNFAFPDLTPNCVEQVLVDQSNRLILTSNTTSGGRLSALDASGNSDLTFGSAGSTALPDTVCDAKIDPRNRILVLTETPAGFEVSRYDSNGTLDTSFGVGGHGAVVSPAGDIAGFSMQLNRDDSIVVLGADYSYPGEYKMLAAKLDSSGALDTTFGTLGLITVPVPSAPMEITFPRAIAIDGKGSIYLTGYTTRDDGNLVTSTAKLTADGKLDTGFGGGGYVETDVGAPSATFRFTDAASISVDARNRLVISGASSDGLEPQFFVARYFDDGVPDVSFNGGVVRMSVAGTIETDAGFSRIDARGRIVVTGSGITPGYDVYLAAGRLNDDGTVDTTFGTGGGVLLSTTAWNGYCALTHDEDILIMGRALDDSSIYVDQLINNPSMIVSPPTGF